MGLKQLASLSAFSIAALWSSDANAQSAVRDWQAVDPMFHHCRTDAALRDVCFINHELGWAVGDHGTILRTTDGGRTWTLVPVDETCSLVSVAFVDELNGWVAGGRFVPLMERSHAVILRTRDGGKTWNPIVGTMLPALRELRMTSVDQGWAWGPPTGQFPSGVFVTNDGGNSWSDFSRWAPQRWRDAAATRVGHVVLSAEGQLLLLQDGEQRSVQVTGSPANLRHLEFFDADKGWALGSRQIWETPDAGKSWRPVGLPPETRGTVPFEFLAAAQVGSTRWLAGSPGTYIFSQDVQTLEWRRSRTSSPATIHRIRFLDESRGWAVGDWGQILATNDGGATWHAQRSAPKRVGLLVIGRSGNCIPFEMLARFSADQGIIAAVAVGPTASELGDGDQRTRQACQMQGVSTLADLNLDSDQDAIAQLTGLIRQWRPTAIVIADEPSGSGSPGVGKKSSVDLAAVVLAAVQAATNGAADREWISEAALPPWQAPLVCQTIPRPGSATWGTPEYLPSLSRNLYDQSLLSTTLLKYPPMPPETHELTTLSNRSSISANGLFHGLTSGPLAPPCRGELSPLGTVGQVKAINSKGSILQELLTQFDSSPASLKVWRQRVDRLIAMVSSEWGANWLWQLSEAYWRNNQPELAAFARAALVESCPDHPLSWESRLWLTHYYASEEYSWNEFSQQQAQVEGRLPTSDPQVRTASLRSAPERVEIDGMTHLIWTVETPESEKGTIDPRAAIQAQNPSSSADFAAFRNNRLAIARSLYTSLMQRDPELAIHPLARFGECMSRRTSDGPIATESALRRISTKSLPPRHQQLIAREIKLHGSEAESLPGLIACSRSDVHPYLDGVLNDEIWRTVAQSQQLIQLSPVVPQSPGDGLPQPASRSAHDPNLSQTQVMLAHDDEYLYLAVICHRLSPAGLARDGNGSKRVRDQSLAGDHWQIAIDVDRDGRSFYLFSVDSNGSFADRLGEKVDWDPNWYFAHASTELNWIVEAAIPWDQLGPRPTGEIDMAWTVSIRRKRSDGLLEFWSPTKTDATPLPLEAGLALPELFRGDGAVLFR